MDASDAVKNFWDNGPFYRRLSSFPGFGIESTADKIGTIAAGVTAAGIAAHAIGTNIMKKKIIQSHIQEGRSGAKELDIEK